MSQALSSLEENASPDWFDWLEQRVGRTGFVLLCALFSFCLLQVFVAPNNLLKILSGHLELAEDVGRFKLSYLPLAADPFSGQTPLYQQCRLRILGPLISYVMHIRGTQSVFIPWIASLPAMVCAIILFRRIVRPSLTFGLAILLPTLHPFLVANSWPGFQDSLATGAVLLAMCLSTWWTILPCIFIGMLADERCITGAGLVLCWHWMQDDPKQAWKLVALRFAGVCGAFFLWIAYGFWQLRHVNMTIHDITANGTSSFIPYLENIPNCFYLTFKAAWAIALIGIYLIAKRQRILAAVVAVMIFPALLASVAVADMSRVVGHAIPVVFIGLLAIRRYGQPWLVPILLAVTITNLLSPSLSGVGDVSRGFNSVPMTVLLYVIRRFH